MESNRRANTGPERALRSELHRRGLRFRKDLRLPLAGCSVRPDIVFTRARVAIFVDGCFWHRCPDHALEPRTNADYWRDKFARNVVRDEQNNEALAQAGWNVVRVWEHEDPIAAADRVEQAVRPQSAAAAEPD